jgi:predicted outer membrane protein
MSKQNWTRGIWAVAAIMATGVALAASPQQTANDPAAGQAPGTAQRSGQRSADGNQNQGRATNGRADVDSYLLKVVLQANRDEIATGRLASQRASNQNVKKFAMQMVEDHTRLMNRLQQFQGQRHGASSRMNRQPAYNASNRGTLNNAAATTSGTQSQATDTANDHNATSGTVTNAAPVTSGTQSQASDTANDHNAAGVGQTTSAPGTYNQAAPAGRQLRGQMAGQQMAGQTEMAGRHTAARQFVTIMDEVATQTQRTMQRELSQKEGVQFDRCYLSGQVMDHIWLIEALKVFERNASPGLQPILQEGLQTAEQHLTHAKALLAKIEQGQAKSTAQHDAQLPVTR